jgi:hypothetical protein
MILASLLLNIIVLIPVCTGLLLNADRMKQTAGIFTPARGILVAMYLTILLFSIVLLFFQHSVLIFALLSMQIVYKSLSPITVKTLKNPIVISNLLIAAFHAITIYTMIQNNTVIINIPS